MLPSPDKRVRASEKIEAARIIDEIRSVESKGKTKPKVGKVYFLACRSAEQVKIGYTSSLKKRVLVLQTGSPHYLDVVACFSATQEAEKIIHKALSIFRMRNEWFYHNAHVDDLMRRIEDYEILNFLQSGEYCKSIPTDEVRRIVSEWAEKWHGTEINYIPHLDEYIDDEEMEMNDG